MNETRFSVEGPGGSGEEFRGFPYRPKVFQVDLLRKMVAAARAGRPFVLHAPTGSGKTVCALWGALGAANLLFPGEEAAGFKSGGSGSGYGKVLFLTRTNSQQLQAIREVREINRAVGSGIVVCGVQGREKMCPLLREMSHEDPSLASGSPEELSRWCSHRKKKTLEGKKGGCRFYAGFRSMDRGWFTKWFRENTPTPEEMADVLGEMGVCPYEATKEVLAEADVVVAPYIYFFNPLIRNGLLEAMRVSLGDLVVVVDEAHNLPDFAREISSIELSVHTVRMARAEVEKLGDPVVFEGLRASDVCDAVSDVIHRLADTYCGEEEDALLPAGEFSVEILSSLGVSSPRLSAIIESLLAMGEAVRREKLERGKLPRSYLHSMASFLYLWGGVDPERYAHLVVREGDGKNPRIEAFCLDPSVATSDLNRTRWSVHMSGTLAPVEEYSESVGLENPLVHISPWPFPPENRLVLFAGDTTTRYEEWKKEETKNRMAEYVGALYNFAVENSRNTIFFFPSYSILHDVLAMEDLAAAKRGAMAGGTTGGTAGGDGSGFFVDERGLSQRDLMDMVSSFVRDGGVLFSVTGGRVSEGMDFPGEALEMVVICGLPYSRPSARQRALVRYYDMRYGRGWEYIVSTPMKRKTAQAVGRLIRSENDRGVAVILDWRARVVSDVVGPMEEVSSPVSLVRRLGVFFVRSQNTGIQIR